jgi:ubiquinone/menaquinone biosynthesis C-methylase UbiE
MEHFKSVVTNSREYFASHKLSMASTISEGLNGRILEIGVGVRVEFFSENLDIVTLDITPQMSLNCKKNFPTVEVVTGDVKYLPFKAGCFDSVISINLLHHLVGINHVKSRNNIKKAVLEIKNVLRSKGVWISYDMFAANRVFSLILFYFTLFCAKFGIEIRKLDIHSKVVTYFITSKSLIKILAGANLKTRILKTSDWVFHSIVLGSTDQIMRITKE